jgi:hypothetical protein
MHIYNLYKWQHEHRFNVDDKRSERNTWRIKSSLLKTNKVRQVLSLSSCCFPIIIHSAVELELPRGDVESQDNDRRYKKKCFEI